MTTPTSTSNNKTALRASLKKEDESLAERLVATDIPLVAPPEPEAPVAAAPQVDAPVAAAPARKSVAKPTAAKPAAKPVVAKPAAKPAVAKPAAKPASKPAVAVSPAPEEAKATGKAEKKAAPVKADPVKANAAVTAPSAAAKAKRGSKKAATEVTTSVSEKPAKPQNAAKLGAAVEKLEKAAKEKGDKIVRYTVELLKSEEAAIETVRAELAKAAGWAASKSDIVRAGVRVFAQQRLDQMKELLSALATPAKAKKKG